MISKTPWWKGPRGEWYVIIQIMLFGVVIFGPRTLAGLPVWTYPFTVIGSIIGGIFIITGGLLITTGIFKLGINLTAVPYPKEGAVLVETGPYRFVRHPLYAGAVLMAFGWALWAHGWLTIVYALILFIFFDIKSRREEIWLKEKFTGYANYQKRVYKLIPFIY